MSNYTDNIIKDSPILHELNEAALAYSYMQRKKFFVEGNVIYLHPFNTKTAPFHQEYFEKRKNLWGLAQTRFNFLDIGFNAGHSALIMLLSNPDAQLICFDLCYHEYVIPCFKILSGYFPQIKLCYGDSQYNLPVFIKENPDVKFDLIHIDGSHESNIVNSDYESAKKLSTAEAVIVFDDATARPIQELIAEKVAAGEIYPVDYQAMGLRKTTTQGLYHLK